MPRSYFDAQSQYLHQPHEPDMTRFLICFSLLFSLVSGASAADGPVAMDQATLADTSWVTVQRPKRTLQFVGTESVRGYAGCNNFRGSIKFADGLFEIGPLAMTRKFCGAQANKAESQFVNNLGNTAGIFRLGNVLELHDQEGATLMQLTEASNK